LEQQNKVSANKRCENAIPLERKNKNESFVPSERNNKNGEILFLRKGIEKCKSVVPSERNSKR